MKTKGFTLVELLVVIAILAILATVSVVGYTTFISDANESVIVQELTQVKNALIAEDITNADFAITLGDSTNKDGKIEYATGKDSVSITTFAKGLGLDGEVAVDGNKVTYTYKGLVGTWNVAEDTITVAEEYSAS